MEIRINGLTPKEKAKELIGYYYDLFEDSSVPLEGIRSCALFCCHESSRLVQDDISLNMYFTNVRVFINLYEF